MNKKNASLLLLAASPLALIPLLGSVRQSNSQEFSEQTEVASLRRAASETLRVPLEQAEFRSEANLVGFRSKEVLLSRRTDSRTYFVQDLRKKGEGERKYFRGSDEQILGRLHEIFKGLEVPDKEIVRERVLQEQTQEGRLDHATAKLMMEEQRAGQRWATAAREVEGLPVYSSRALLGLGAEGETEYLELHWPSIPAETLAEAHRLQYRVREGWKAPAVLGAHMESAEAGIVHSPAVGFVMDVHPVIRVVYAPDEKKYGKKAVRYLDRNGRDVPLPRQFGTLPEELRGSEKPLRQRGKQ
jgi:hypothetical protein